MLEQRADATSSVQDPVRRQVRPSNVPTSGSSLSSVGAQSTIGKTLLIKGEITGSGSVNIEGKVEGSIELQDDRVSGGTQWPSFGKYHSAGYCRARRGAWQLQGK
jgi:hypothetical protein